VLRDVFEAGDAWFRSGDLMRTDAAGYYYFVDRLGDTFRWKGENVSTLEVATALATVPGVRDIAVYGVAVPGHDGKAGMACLQVDDTFSLTAFHETAARALPAYALPIFLRIGASLAVTDTFKHRKQALADEGYGTVSEGDRLFVRLADGAAYVPLCDTTRRAIESGALRI
jgi:fatty-acyl-CoA synthase